MKLYSTLVFILSFFWCNSCTCSEVSRLSYQQSILDFDSVPGLPMKHKHWKSVKFSDYICGNATLDSKTVLLVDNDYTIDQLSLPIDVELYFCGGGLKGDIAFNNTYLSGKVKLHGSNISGSIANDVFEAGWLCYGDAKMDDAKNINQILGVCDKLHFNKGTYLLSSYHTVAETIPAHLQHVVNSHIGLFRDNVSLFGENGASFLIKDIGVAICAYSKPNDIKHSTRNIHIDGLAFRVENDERSFNEFIHTIKLVGVNGMTIMNCQFFDFWGDAICLSHYYDGPETGERTLNRHVKILNNYIDGGNHNNRNGVSIVSGFDVLVEGNTILETSKGNMPGAIDVEANNTAYTIEKIVIKENTISNCKGGVGAICVVSNEQEAPARRIVIDGNTIKSSSKGICLLIDSQNATENIKVLNNVFKNCSSPLIFRGKGKSRNWVIKGNKLNVMFKPKVGGDIQLSNLKTDIL